MGLKFGDISPLAGLVSGQGMFGRAGRDLGLKYATDAGGNPVVDDKGNPVASSADKAKASSGVVGKAKGGPIATAVHKHERALHKGEPLTKLAKGGSASTRADGCITKGRTKGRVI